MIEKLTKSYDNSGVGLLLPDLTKAFDSLRRDLLIAKPATHCFFFYNNVVHKIQTVFLTNKIKRNNYNKTWDYTNTVPITTRGSLGLNTK